MTTMNISQQRLSGLPPALQRAQTAIQLPEVQAMLRRLSEFELGIFVPHQHDDQTGDFLPLAAQTIQVESGCRVSFQCTESITSQADRFLPVAWLWRFSGLTPASVCEMDLGDRPESIDGLVKHKMTRDR